MARLRVQKSVLVVPGDHFFMDHYLRIGFGDEATRLREGLSRFDDLLDEDDALRTTERGLRIEEAKTP